MKKYTISFYEYSPKISLVSTEEYNDINEARDRFYNAIASTFNSSTKVAITFLNANDDVVIGKFRAEAL